VEGEPVGDVEFPVWTEEDMLLGLVAANRAVSTASARDPFEEVVAHIIVDAARAVRASRAAIWLQRDDAIEVVATTGVRATTVDRFQHVPVAPDTPGEDILRRRNPVTWSTHAEGQRYFPAVTVANFGSGYVSPLHVADSFAGVLFVGWSQQDRMIASAERAFLEGIAHCCAFAIERSDVYDDLDVSEYDEIIAIGDAFSVKLARTDVQSIVWIAGEIDFANERELEHALQAVIRDHTRGTLALDLGGVEFLSAKGARVILRATGQATEDVTVSILNASQPARRVLDLLAR
jgi:anti-anti-sigma factor